MSENHCSRVVGILRERWRLFAGASTMLYIFLAATSHNSIEASLRIDDVSAAIQSQGACNTSVFPSQRRVRVDLKTNSWNFSLNWDFVVKDNNYLGTQVQNSVYSHRDCLIAISAQDKALAQM